MKTGQFLSNNTKKNPVHHDIVNEDVMCLKPSNNHIDGYRVRLRFHVIKPFNSVECEINLNFRNAKVVLSAQDNAKPIADNNWLVLNACGIENEENAQKLGIDLKACCDIAGAAVRYGINTGADKPTSRLSEDMRESIYQTTGAIIRDDVHGIDIFPDNGNVRFLCMSGSGLVRANSDKFTDALKNIGASYQSISQKSMDAIFLLNNALTKTDPVSQIVFSISAVEMLGQTEEWTENQLALRDHLVSETESSSLGSAEERQEVKESIRKGLHRLSLRQGALRILKEAGLTRLKKKWDEIYRKRSTLVHGLAPVPGVRYDQLAYEVVTICGHILLKYVARELPIIGEYADLYYPVNTHDNTQQ